MMNSDCVFAWFMLVYHPSCTIRALYGVWINNPVTNCTVLPMIDKQPDTLVEYTKLFWRIVICMISAYPYTSLVQLSPLTSFSDFQYSKMRPEVEIAVMGRHLAEMSRPIERPPSVSYLCCLNITRRTLAVCELLWIFSVLKPDRKWESPFIGPI